MQAQRAAIAEPGAAGRPAVPGALRVNADEPLREGASTTAKLRKKGRGTAGGAAVAAGAGFQERVAAFAMAHALIGDDGLALLTWRGPNAMQHSPGDCAGDRRHRAARRPVPSAHPGQRSVSLSEALDSPFSKP